MKYLRVHHPQGMKFIGATEFARLAGLSSARVREMMKRGELSGYHYERGQGRRGYAIMEKDALEWMCKHRSNVIPFRPRMER